ncbi:hypothetical protein Echvi_3870 [Echinicola vietnamensis DSM 17526]|uniref:Uncharacterized protein n=1 Tax=Echinicola vietnamensis (strain DSM 17526 / LMG 23754 / KMM 6221) TaxID=926556 RepID=L0G3J4_ECHVK|nr:hypothetical protein Echvi_3870 [Echinicola vietnamensis DSM 17526]
MAILIEVLFAALVTNWKKVRWIFSKKEGAVDSTAQR